MSNQRSDYFRNIFNIFSHTTIGDKMKKETLWQEKIEPLVTEEIPKHLEVDILIIGGGIAGISTLFELKPKKETIALIDQDQIGMGTTARTTGKLCYMQELCYHKLEKIFNFDTARLYLEATMNAIKQVKHHILTNQIACDYEEVDAYVFTNDETEIPTFEKEEAFYEKASLPYQREYQIPLDTPVKYALKTSNQAVFHPLKYLYALVRLSLEQGKKIYQNVRAQTITKIGEHYQVTTDKGTILAKKIIVCTHYPFFIHPGFIPFRTHIENSFITTTNTNENYHFQAITSNKPTDSFRFHYDEKNYFLYAGESSKNSNHFDYEQRLEELQHKLYFDFKVTPDYIWYTHDIMTNDSLPFIGPINHKNPNLMIATGFNKWGMTNGVLAGMILSDLIMGKENKYAKIVSPSRRINMEKVKNFFIDGFTSTKSIIKAKFIKDQPFYQDNVKITYEDGVRIGIYKDAQGKLHKVKNVCPHMKCNLIFNYIDTTWDCPCHGSKFDIDGNVLKGPSVYSIQLEKKKKD